MSSKASQKGSNQKISYKTAKIIQKKKSDKKAHVKELVEKQKHKQEEDSWSTGINERAKSRTDLMAKKKIEADRKRQDKLDLQRAEESEIRRIKQIRQNRIRSKSMGQEPVPMPRRGRSQSMDETVPNPHWKTPPKLTRSQSGEESMQKLLIMTLNGDEHAIALVKSSTVSDVKLRVEEVCGIPAVSQELLSLVHNKPLVDKHKLIDLNLPANSVIFCSNHAGTVKNWANFHHFRSPQKPKKHIQFSDNEQTATKTATHPCATYVFTAGAVSGVRGGPVRVWQLKVQKIDDKGSMAIGLFQGRDLRMQQEPWPIPKNLNKPRGIDTQSPMWCISNEGQYKTPDESGCLPAKRSWGEKRFSTGDVIQVALYPDRQELEISVTHAATSEEEDPASSSDTDSTVEGEIGEVGDGGASDSPLPEHLYTMPLGLGEKDDLHFFATLHTQGDSVTIKECE